MKVKPLSTLWGTGGADGRKARFLKKFAGAAFLFFLLKGLVWLGIAGAAAWAALR